MPASRVPASVAVAAVPTGGAEAGRRRGCPILQWRHHAVHRSFAASPAPVSQGAPPPVDMSGCMRVCGVRRGAAGFAIMIRSAHTPACSRRPASPRHRGGCGVHAWMPAAPPAGRLRSKRRRARIEAAAAVCLASRGWARAVERLDTRAGAGGAAVFAAPRDGFAGSGDAGWSGRARLARGIRCILRPAPRRVLVDTTPRKNKNATQTSPVLVMPSRRTAVQPPTHGRGFRFDGRPGDTTFFFFSFFSFRFSFSRRSHTAVRFRQNGPVGGSFALGCAGQLHAALRGACGQAKGVGRVWGGCVFRRRSAMSSGERDDRGRRRGSGRSGGGRVHGRSKCAGGRQRRGLFSPGGARPIEREHRSNAPAPSGCCGTDASFRFLLRNHECRRAPLVIARSR